MKFKTFASSAVLALIFSSLSNVAQAQNNGNVISASASASAQASTSGNGQSSASSTATTNPRGNMNTNTNIGSNSANAQSSASTSNSNSNNQQNNNNAATQSSNQNSGSTRPGRPFSLDDVLNEIQNSGSSNQNNNNNNNQGSGSSTITSSSSGSSSTVDGVTTTTGSSQTTEDGEVTSSSSTSASSDGVNCSISAQAFSGRGGQFVSLLYSGVSQGTFAQCEGTFMPFQNKLVYNCFDDEGILRTQTNQYFPSELTPDCYETTGRDLAVMLTNYTSGPMSTNQGKINILRAVFSPEIGVDTQFNCCDLYQQGEGYVFTQCDNNIGVIALPNKLGTEMDIRYEQMNEQVNQTLADLQLSQSSAQNQEVASLLSELNDRLSQQDNQNQQQTRPQNNNQQSEFGSFAQMHPDAQCPADLGDAQNLGVKFTEDNYAAPADCQFREGMNGLSYYVCESNDRKVCYSSGQMNHYWENNLSSLCYNALDLYYQCDGEVSCYQQEMMASLFNTGLTNMYGWLHYDTSSALEIREACYNIVPDFCQVYDIFAEGFQGQFGDICSFE